MKDQKEDLFEHRRSVKGKIFKKRVKFAICSQKFTQRPASKMVKNELEVHNNSQTGEEVDDDKIRLNAIPLLKKDLPSPRSGPANALVSSTTSNVTQVLDSTPELKRIITIAWKHG